MYSGRSTRTPEKNSAQNKTAKLALLVVTAGIITGTVVIFNVSHSERNAAEFDQNILPRPTSSTNSPNSPEVSVSASASNTSPSSGDSWSKSIPVAIKFVSIYNNAVGSDNPSPFSWVEKLESLMTKTGYQDLKKLNVPPDPESYRLGSPDYQTAHEMKLNVISTTQCVANGAAQKPTATNVMLACSFRLYTADEDGRSVPSESMPGIWVYGSGSKGIVNLTMKKQDKVWKVVRIENQT